MERHAGSILMLILVIFVIYLSNSGKLERIKTVYPDTYGMDSNSPNPYTPYDKPVSLPSSVTDNPNNAPGAAIPGTRGILTGPIGGKH